MEISPRRSENPGIGLEIWIFFRAHPQIVLCRLAASLFFSPGPWLQLNFFIRSFFQPSIHLASIYGPPTTSVPGMTPATASTKMNNPLPAGKPVLLVLGEGLQKHVGDVQKGEQLRLVKYRIKEEG